MIILENESNVIALATAAENFPTHSLSEKMFDFPEKSDFACICHQTVVH